MKNTDITYSEYRIKKQQVRILDFSSRRAMEVFVHQQNKTLQFSKNSRELQKLKRRATTAAAEQDPWYGKPLITQPNDLTEHNEYLHFDLLKRLRPKVRKHMNGFTAFQDENKVERKKIAYNDKEIGIFSFDRAAMGLRKIIKDGETKIVSDVKKSYAYHETKSTAENTIKLYIHAGGTGDITGEQMVYSGIASSLVTELLVDKGFNVQVNVIIGTKDRDQIVFSISRVKSFTGELNMNDLLLLSSSPRYYRYKGFACLIAAWDAVGWTIPLGKGASSFNHQLKKEILRQHRKGEEKAILLDRAYSEYEVTQVIKNALNEANNRS